MISFGGSGDELECARKNERMGRYIMIDGLWATFYSRARNWLGIMKLE